MLLQKAFWYSRSKIKRCCAGGSLNCCGPRWTTKRKIYEEKGKRISGFRVNQENNTIVRWFDNKAVDLFYLFILFFFCWHQTSVKLWDRKSKTQIMVPRTAIVEIHKFMGCVDLLDMLSALYKFSFKSRRWYMYIWWHTVTVAVISAWNLYRRDWKKLEPQMKPLAKVGKGFKLLLALLKCIKCGRPLSSPEPDVTPHCKGKILHFPLHQEAQ